MLTLNPIDSGRATRARDTQAARTSVVDNAPPARPAPGSAILKVAALPVIFCLFLSSASGQARSEQQLIDILRSGAGLREKDAACAELKRAGTLLSVPALAGLLPDRDLSHAARYALETMPGPEAGEALVGALAKTGGLVRAGIIQSLGRRREIGAIPALKALLIDPDAGTSAAAASALGRIGGAAAIDSLFTALPENCEASRRAAVLAALIAAADRELEAGRRETASAVFARLRKMPLPEHIRAAAYRGLIASAGQAEALELVKTAIQGKDGPEQMAALEIAPMLKVPGMIGALRDLLTKAAPPLQVALIEALRRRGDPDAAPSLLAMAGNPDREVRVAALGGLGEIGDAAAVGVLLEAAGSADEIEMRTARRALAVLSHGEISPALIGHLTGGPPRAQVEAARALSSRGDRDALPSLVAAARQSQEPVRGAAYHALGQLAAASDIPALVNLVTAAPDNVALEQARDALGSACLRLTGLGVSVDSQPIVAALDDAAPATRAALLQAGSCLADERLRAALRTALKDPDKEVQDAAARALWETRDPGLLPDLLSAAVQAPDLNGRVPAVRGYIRLVSDLEDNDLGPGERVKALAGILPWARAEEKWLALSGLAKVHDPASLELALTMLDDPATRGEAAQAVTAIASVLVSKHREHARMGLERVLAVSSDPGQREAALAVLGLFDPTAGTASPVKFRKVQLDGAFRSEGLAVADFDRDGRLDIATGNILYLGSDWKPRPMRGEPKAYDPENYSDEFLCFDEDIDRDGWTDLVVVGFPGAKTRWQRNPGRLGGPWNEFPAVEKTGNESPDWADVDGDGRKELVFVSENGMALAGPGADPARPWPIRVVASPGDPRPGHGLGLGDVNGDGRDDIVCPEGWWEGPEERGRIPWAFHAAKLGFEAPAQMPVIDADGDGDADIISSGAHRYGLWWYEQSPEGWQAHSIDLGISQLHAVHLADINRDGLPDIVTGKRFWAHRHNDDGIDDPSVLCWFEARRETGRPSWVRHDIDFASGVGLHVCMRDLDGDGLLDIATSNKKGVYVFIQETTR
jgi:HEAT repeat protein